MPERSGRTTLADVSLFRGFSAEELEGVAAVMHEKILPPSSFVIIQDQPAHVLYVVLSGSLKVQVDLPDGTQVVVAVVGPGEVLGEMGLIDGRGRSATVITLDDCTLLWMDRESFETCLQNYPVMTRNLLEIMSGRMRQANEHVQALASMDMVGRVAHTLLSLADRYGRPGSDGGVLIPIPLNQSDLAGLIGASRVRVNQVLGEFKKRGYLTISRGHRVTIRDPAGLEKRAQN